MSAQTISGVGVNLFGRLRQLYAWAVAIVGQDPSGNPAPIKVDSSGNILVASTGAGAQRAPTITTASASGSIAAGSRKNTLIFSGDFTGSVLGVAFSGAVDGSLTIDAPSGDTLAAIAYIVTAGSIRIITVT